jgi:hypothetical protein
MTPNNGQPVTGDLDIHGREIFLYRLLHLQLRSPAWVHRSPTPFFVTELAQNPLYHSVIRHQGKLLGIVRHYLSIFVLTPSCRTGFAH